MARRHKKRVLITGMTASHRRAIDGTPVTTGLKKALEHLKYEVIVESPSMAGPLSWEEEKWDHVFVGLGPLKSLAANSKYGALAMIGKHYDHCTFFIDDLDSKKIGREIIEMKNNPDRLVKPFWSYVKDWEIAANPDVAQWLSDICRVIHEDTDGPMMIVPAFGADPSLGLEAAEGALPGSGYRGVPVDFSRFAMPPTYKKLLHEDDPVLVRQGWISDVTPDHKIMGMLALGSDLPIYRVQEKSFTSIVPYSIGYVWPMSAWTARIAQTLHRGKPVVIRWGLLGKLLGEEFEPTVWDIEHVTAKKRDGIARAQKKRLLKIAASTEELAVIVEGTMKR